MVAATVFNPVHGECYTAAKGCGAYLNGKRLHVSGVTELKQALVAASFPPKVAPDSPVLTDFARIIVASQSVRRTGSAALNLCYVAAGRFDAYWARETLIWDVAAGWLIVCEAGGVMTALDGKPFRLDRPQFIAAASEPLHRRNSVDAGLRSSQYPTSADGALRLAMSGWNSLTYEYGCFR